MGLAVGTKAVEKMFCGDKEVTDIFLGSTHVWPTEQPTPEYLCFTAGQSNSTVAMERHGTPTHGQSFETSTDGTAWTAFVPGTTTITLANVGDKVYFRGDNVTVSESQSCWMRFVLSGEVAASGNIMSLLDKTVQSLTIGHEYCFTDLFAQSYYALTSAPTLPATTLSDRCYSAMFYNCTALTSAPALPATALTPGCYLSMFVGCSALTTAPNLSAETLDIQCYYRMFKGCSSLSNATALPARSLKNECYYMMFADCVSLTTVPSLPATALAPYCYHSMFEGCEGLKVYSASGTGHTAAWRIPTEGSASSYAAQNRVFYGTVGDYATADPVNLNATFYTQNTPVS